MFFHFSQTLNPSPKFFPHLRKVLELNLVQEVVFAIALQHSQNPETRALALDNTKKQLPELIRNYLDSSSSNKRGEEGLHDSSPEVLHLILTYILQETNGFELLFDTKETFLKNLRRDFPSELVPVVLAPLLYPGDGDVSWTSTRTNMTANQMVRKTFETLK